MSDIGGGNSAFDDRFLDIERAGVILVLVFLLALLAWRGVGYRLPRWPAALLVVAALVLGPGIAIYWQAAYPSANGIEGAGRFLFGGAATLGNATLAGLGAFALLERRVRWVALAPAGMAIVFWVLFLL
ncbi:MAG: hypothetical protein WDO74_26260 [Pseudomonadota bacterium]